MLMVAMLIPFVVTVSVGEQRELWRGIYDTQVGEVGVKLI
jgi:hypothetical protein